MSLINEALKRAKEAQDTRPATVPATGLTMRHAEPEVHRGTEPAAMFAGLLILFTGLCAVFAWQLQRHQREMMPIAAPGRATVVVSVPAVRAAPLVVEPTPQVSAPPAAVAPVAANIVTNQAAPTLAPVVIATEPVHAAEAPPAPAPIRLQAIFFNPSRPSAMIDGQSVVVGDEVGEFHLSAITAKSVTLISPTSSNVLTLSGD